MKQEEQKPTPKDNETFPIVENQATETARPNKIQLIADAYDADRPGTVQRDS